MRIWIVNQYAQPPQHPGNTRTHSFARGLVSRAHQVTIVASPKNYLSRRQTRETPAAEEIEGVGYVWIKARGYNGNNGGRVLGMLEFATRVACLKTSRVGGRPDVVIGSSPPPFGAAAALFLARRTKAAFVLEVRDIWPDTVVDLGHVSRSHPFIRVLSFVEKTLYRSSIRTVSVLPDGAEVIEARGGKRGSVTWIPNGVDIDMVGEPPRQVATGPLVAMYAGAHGQANGLDTILDAAAILQQNQPQRWRFRLIGDGVDKEHLERRALAEGISCVAFEEPVPKTEIYRLLHEADAFLLHLRKGDLFRYGTSPNKLFDYLASARPVVYAVNSSNDPVTDAQAGISIEPEDPEAMANALEKIGSMTPEERQAMGRRGRAYVLENHDIGRLAQRLEAVLIEAAEANPFRRGVRQGRM